MRLLVTGGNGQLGSELKLLSGNYPFEFVFVDLEDLDLLDNQAVSNFFNKIVSITLLTVPLTRQLIRRRMIKTSVAK